MLLRDHTCWRYGFYSKRSARIVPAYVAFTEPTSDKKVLLKQPLADKFSRYDRDNIFLRLPF